MKKFVIIVRVLTSLSFASSTEEFNNSIQSLLLYIVDGWQKEVELDAVRKIKCNETTLYGPGPWWTQFQVVAR